MGDGEHEVTGAVVARHEAKGYVVSNDCRERALKPVRELVDLVIAADLPTEQRHEWASGLGDMAPEEQLDG